MKLFDWQEPILGDMERIYRQRDSALLIASPGAGKTYIASQLLKNRLPKRAMILCPKSVIPMWTKVLNEFGVTVGQYSFVVNYEALTSNSKLAKSGELGKWRRKIFEWSLPKDIMIIFDEAHRCGGKGGKTKTCGLLVGAKKMGLPHLMMTATFADDPLRMKGFGYSLDLFRLSDFWTWALNHGVRKARFHNGFEFPQSDAPYYLGKINEQIFDPEDAVPRGKLVKMEDVLQFYPEGHVYAEPVQVSESQEKKMRSQYGEEFNRLSQAIEDAEYELVEQLHMHQEVEMLKVSVFKEQAQDLLAEGFSVVIFVNFRATAEKLCQELKTESLIIGEQKPETREQVIDDFQTGRSNLVIVTAAAGGEAISLHDLHGDRPRVSLLSPVWSPVRLRQVLGRIHRTGGKSLVTQKILVLPGIEEKVYAKVMQRTENMNTVSGDNHQLVEE